MAAARGVNVNLAGELIVFDDGDHGVSFRWSGISVSLNYLQYKYNMRC